MTEPPAPRAARLRAPSWRDPRLLVGVVLVLASVVLGARVVAAADDAVPVFAAAGTLLPGHALGAGDVRVVRVRLGEGQDRYVPAGQDLPPDRVVLRSVQPGELLPRSAVGARDQVDLKPVSVPVPREVAEPLRAGTLVDVWVARRKGGAGQQTYEAPRRLVRSAEVAGTATAGGALAGASTSAVQVLLTEDLVPLVLGAVDNGARVDLVPLPGSVPRDER